ncbi:hypothetical protein [Bacteriovorax sp. DB6_IX]|uniref:hypothetical protein n=1 Tax=Bacteriovorax sp. DB6_IX TaxID=1353530 RepID=UPI0012FA5927|nr:hypothetical protein [Bacteriovorax sp. DB6_IX]
MSYFGNGKEGEKIFRGAYTYMRNTNIYSEESFEVFRDKKEMTYTFVSELISRVSTGELLNINTIYKINKDYTPLYVDINRSLGNSAVNEKYEFDMRRTRINYTFTNNDGERHNCELTTNPKFFITTSASCSSMLYLRSKKFDNTGKNYYTIFTSNNHWQFNEEPSVKNIVIQRISQTSESLKVGKSNLDAIQYKLTEQILGNEDGPADPHAPPAQENDIRIWCSQHMTIPYLIKDRDGTKIEVKYLNNLDKDQ